jgi:hypothetical protein
MTLVIAHKLNNTISFSSDSRISFGTQGHIDFGVKVFSVPVKIFSPTTSDTNITTLDYNYNLGMAVIGSAINAYTVKESIYEFLQHLQYMPGYTNLSMDSIANIVFKVYTKTTKGLAPILQRDGLCQILLGGYCPEQNKIRVFEYSVNISNTIIPTLNEILINDGLEFYGSGKTDATKIYTQNVGLKPLHIIREAINDGNIDTVGGGLQYGEFVINNFQVFGVEDYKLNNDGSFGEYLYTLRGLNLYKDEFERENNDFHIAYSFKRPFESEINQAMKDYIDKN